MKEEPANSKEVPAKAVAVVEKMTVCTRFVDTTIEKGLGFIGDRPWKSWLDIANRYIGLFLPSLIGIAGLLATFFWLIAAIKYELPYTMAVAYLLGTLFSLHLAPKAMALVVSLVEKGEPEKMRPEVLYILRVLCGLGGVLFAITMILEFDMDLLAPIVMVLGVAVLMTIACLCPEMVGVKAGHPQNAVEECLSILLFPIRILLSLFPIVMGVATVGAFIYGFTLLTEEYVGIPLAASTWATAAMLPLAVSLSCYLAMLVLHFVLDLYRALVSIPRKLDEVRDALKEKK